MLEEKERESGMKEIVINKSTEKEQINTTIPEDILEFLEVENCEDFPIATYFKTDDLVKIAEEILQAEQVKRIMKTEYKRKYLNSVLLYGPPGTGKTTFARYIAYRMEQPFVYLNFSKIVQGGVLGNSIQNIYKIFTGLFDVNCIFTLDEIDTIATNRNHESSVTGGELSRMTVTVMQMLDAYKKNYAKPVVLGLTNCEAKLDKALISRFSIHRKVDILKNEDKMRYIKLLLDDIHVTLDDDIVKNYCANNHDLAQRGIENDINRGLFQWIAGGKEKGKFVLEHIQDEDL